MGRKAHLMRVGKCPEVLRSENNVSERDISLMVIQDSSCNLLWVCVVRLFPICNKRDIHKYEKNNILVNSLPFE